MVVGGAGLRTYLALWIHINGGSHAKLRHLEVVSVVVVGVCMKVLQKGNIFYKSLWGKG